MPKKTVEIINFNPVPIARPINVPKAGFNDFLKFVFSINSPVNAPKNAPKIRPNGPPVKRPINKPIVAPINPFLEPPSFFNPIIGIKMSNKKTVKEIRNVIINSLLLKGINEVKWITNKPNQLDKGPGIIGVKLPINPVKQRINPKINRKISIFFYNSLFI